MYEFVAFTIYDGEDKETKQEPLEEKLEKVLWEVSKDIFKTYENFFGEYSIGEDGKYVDFIIRDNILKFGIEPAYMYDPLYTITFDLENKDNCALEKGISFGDYGSNVLSTEKLYKDYKKKSKFIKLIDKWYDEIKKVWVYH